MLKKEFNRRDVERMRNLISGKAESSSESQVGYNKKRIKRKEGDVWTENKKTWTIKNGIKQTISKLDKIKKEVHMPLCCPECNKPMNGTFDKPTYRIHKKCHFCIVKFESHLKANNKYDDYIKELKARNSLDMIDDMEAFLLNAINETNSGYISEHGEMQRWVGGVDKNKLTKDVTKAVQIRRKSIKKELSEKK